MSNVSNSYICENLRFYPVNIRKNIFPLLIRYFCENFKAVPLSTSTAKNSGVFRYLATVTETRERVGRGTHTVCIYIHSMCVCMCDGYVDEREVHPEEFNTYMCTFTFMYIIQYTLMIGEHLCGNCIFIHVV